MLQPLVLIGIYLLLGYISATLFFRDISFAWEKGDSELDIVQQEIKRQVDEMKKISRFWKGISKALMIVFWMPIDARILIGQPKQRNFLV